MAAEVEGSISIHRRRDGTIAYRPRLMVDGKRVSYGLCETYEDAERRLAAAVQQRRASSGGMTLRTWGERWLDRREHAGVRAVHKDRNRWKKHVSKSWLAELPLKTIQRADVVRFVRELVVTPRSRDDEPLARQTVVHIVNLVRKALNDAADDALIPGNPAVDVKVPRGRGSMAEPWTWLTLEEIEAVLAIPISKGTDKRPLERNRNGTEAKAITPAQHAILSVAIYTGLRPGEMWALRWRDVILDEKRPELVVRASNDGPTKSGRVRRVPLFAPARAALQAWRGRAPGVGDALVFPGPPSEGAPTGEQHDEGYDADWPRVKELAKIERRVRFYDLRHTCASHLVQGSWGRAWRLEEIQLFLGHSSITVTQRYAHLAPGGLHDLARETAAGPHAGHHVATTAQVIPIDRPRKSAESQED